MTYSRHEDVDIVLTRAKRSFDSIKQMYEESLRGRELSKELPAEIKDYLGNLKSALDYSARKFGSHNFPVRETEKEFNKLKLNYPDSVKAIIRKWQPFNQNTWLSRFNYLNNKSKHLTLIPREKREAAGTRVTHPQMGSFSWTKNVIFSGGISVMGVPIDPQTQLPIENNLVKTEKITWINFVFCNKYIPNFPKGVSVLPFLEECFGKVTKIVLEIEKVSQTKSDD